MTEARVHKVIDVLSKELNLPRDNIVEQGLRTLLEKKLLEVKAEIFRLCGKYGVKSVEDMDNSYRNGRIEEEDSWRDFQRLDHLEYKKEQLEKLLEEIK